MWYGYVGIGIYQYGYALPRFRLAASHRYRLLQEIKEEVTKGRDTNLGAFIA